MKSKLFIVLLAIAVLPFTCPAQDLVFKFTNPAFGGDTFNYQWLLSSVEAQNDFAESMTPEFPELGTDPLDDFENSLNRQILNQLSRKLVEDQFGEGDLEPGSYQFGNYQIEISDSGDGLNVMIMDLGNGDMSTIFIPYY